MLHKKSNQNWQDTGQEASPKRPIEPSAKTSLPKRVGEIFIKTHNLENVCAKIDRLGKWRDGIIDDRALLELPTSQKVLRTAQSMGGKEDTYLANEAGLEKDIAQWPEDIQTILQPLLEKAKFGPTDRIYGKVKLEIVEDIAAGSVDPKVEEDKGEPSGVIDLS